MYSNFLGRLMIGGMLCATLAATANTSENFNSRKGASLKQVKAELQNSCWTFHHFDINLGGWNPQIEGDGAMVSSAGALNANNAGIYTPLLAVASHLDVSFNYRFNTNFDLETVRWLKICLANSSNEVVKVLEEIRLNGAHATRVVNYSTEFRNITPGEYRFVLLYGGNGGSAEIAIDELITSAPYKFTGGCTSTPVATSITVTGKGGENGISASISDAELLKNKKVFLTKNSADGKVELFADGTFLFIPNAGFKGKSTTFTYRVCNVDGTNLCSEPATVRIKFPQQTLLAFRGSYKYDGYVELAWNTEAGHTIRKFEIERSTDGRSWASSGVIEASNSLTNANEYAYTDRVGKNTALKKDLYYRLKQTDADGTVNTSKAMIIRVYNRKTLTMICVAPNPTKREIALNIQLLETSLVSMRIFDRSNNTLIQKTVTAPAGINNIVVEGSRDLVPGDYMLEVIVNSKERMIVKLLKE